MENSHKLGLYISYYLSRFNTQAYSALGFGTQGQTHKKIGEILNINPNTIKNWRDEFDPIHAHRIGWNQRSMLTSRVNVVRAMENLNESQCRLIVTDILSGSLQKDEDALEQILGIVAPVTKKRKKSNFILRGITGKKAEEYFAYYFKKTSEPFQGILEDCREFGVGYDFRIKGKNEERYIEVKGLSEYSGGILFTSKEWEVAQKLKENYYVCIVSRLEADTEILFIRNPYRKLKPKKNIYPVLQINWSVTENQIKKLKR